MEAQEKAQQNYERALRMLRWVLGTLAAVSVVAMVVGGLLMSPDKDKDLWFELFKGGVTLFLATVVGGIVSLLLDKYKGAEDEKIEAERSARDAERTERERAFSRQRDREIELAAEDRRRTDLRLRLLRDIVHTYNDVKAVRRRLRALGLYEPSDGLTATQVEGLHREVSNLLDAQLTFEALAKEVVDTHAFGELTHDFQTKLTGAEEYLNSRKGRRDGVLGEWQEKRGYATVTAGTTAADFRRFALLQDFMGPQQEGKGFKRWLTDPIHEIAETARRQLYPEVASSL